MIENGNFQKILDKLDDLDARIQKLEGATSNQPLQTEASTAQKSIASTYNDPSRKKEPAVKTVGETVTREKKSGFSEAHIGKEWFNKIGALSIIIGVVLFIGYSFQYLGPAGKIAIGYAGAVALILAGLFIAKKYKPYADTMLAVGWAIAYFTTFATHYVEASRVIESSNTNLLLLFFVSAALAIFSYVYNSERFSIMAVVLGAVSAIISPTPFVSLIGILILIFYATGVSILKKWALLGYFSAIASYATYWIALEKQELFYSGDVFRVGSIFLAIYFFLFVATSLFLSSGKFAEKKYVTSLVAFNAFAFFVLFLNQLYQFYPEQDGVFTAIFGSVLLVLALITYLLFSEKKYISIAYAWLGWGFLTLAVPLQLTGAWIASAWLVEGAALLCVGLVRNRKRFIYTGAIAIGLFLLRFLGYDIWQTNTFTLAEITIKSRVVFSLFTALLFAAIGVVWDRYNQKIDQEFRSLVFMPWLGAVLVIMTMIMLDANKNFVSSLYAFEGFVLYVIGLGLNRRYLRMVSLVPLFAFVAYWIGFDLVRAGLVNAEAFGDLNYRTVNGIFGIGIAYLVYFLSQLFKAKLNEDENSIANIFVVAGSILLVFLTFLEGDSKFISVLWTLEASLILAAGFLAKKRILRLIGICILLLAILRVFIIDLSFLETIYRIISFIILGGILMGISFLYTKYKDKILSD